MITQHKGAPRRIETLSRDELKRYARQGRAQDLAAARETLRRHHLRMEALGFEEWPANVVPFTRSHTTPSNDGGAA